MDVSLHSNKKLKPLAPNAPAPSILPEYLIQTYDWAYINPRMVAILDRPWVVNVILWGNALHLMKAMFDELEPGQNVFQPAAVYGDFSTRLAQHLGPSGHLDVRDITPIQVAHTKTKLMAYPYAIVCGGDAAQPTGNIYDAVACFFLLHETPDAYKHKIVDTLLQSVAPGGKVVFIDYHRPHSLHPLRPLMSLVLDYLEPFAKALYTHPISHFASDPNAYSWTTKTYFGGLYQKTVVVRK